VPRKVFDSTFPVVLSHVEIVVILRTTARAAVLELNSRLARKWERNEVHASVREEIGRTFPKHEEQGSVSFCRVDPAIPRQAVSIREAARLLSISPRTVNKYVALKVIRTVRVGRRVLVPMESVNEVASRGIRWRRSQKSTGELSSGLSS
jgi:excisionase family DNA binding protein